MSEEEKNEVADAEQPGGKEKVKQSLFERAMSFLGLEDIGSRKKLDSLRVDSNERLRWEMDQAIDVAGDVIQEKADTVVADDQERTARVIDIATKREIKNPELQSRIDAVKQKQEEMASKLAAIRAEFTAKAKGETGIEATAEPGAETSETKKSRDEIRASKEYQALAKQFNSANEAGQENLKKFALNEASSSRASTETINLYRLFEADARKAKDGKIDVPVVAKAKETDPRPSDKYKVVKTKTEQPVASPDSARTAAAMDVMPKEAGLEAVQKEEQDKLSSEKEKKINISLGQLFEQASLQYLKTKDRKWFNENYSGEQADSGYLLNKDGTESNFLPSNNITGGYDEVLNNAKKELIKQYGTDAKIFLETHKGSGSDNVAELFPKTKSTSQAAEKPTDTEEPAAMEDLDSAGAYFAEQQMAELAEEPSKKEDKDSPVAMEDLDSAGAYFAEQQMQELADEDEVDSSEQETLKKAA